MSIASSNCDKTEICENAEYFNFQFPKMSSDSKIIPVYETMFRNTKFCNLVKLIYDKNTDLIVECADTREKICRSLPEITDLYKYDLMMEYLRYDLFINFFYAAKKSINSKQDGYVQSVINSYKAVIRTDRFKDFLFLALSITDEIFLQERYLAHVHNYFVSHASRYIQQVKPNSLVVETLTKNYLKILKDLQYTSLVKYVNGEVTNLYISSNEIREAVSTQVAVDPEISHITNLYDFEHNDISVISKIVHDNYIKPRIDKLGFINRKKIENIVYNYEVCKQAIKASLGDKADMYDKYIKIIVQNIYTMVNY